VIEALDHVAIAVRDLDRAATAYEALLGRRPDWREEAAGARHAWFQLANMALDIIQPEGAGESGDRVRSQLEAHGEGLWGLAFAVADFEETRRILERRGAPTGEAAALLSTGAWPSSIRPPLTASRSLSPSAKRAASSPGRPALAPCTRWTTW
jgi:catechol 2,3-dioxygenase-like lactoylglutathione lyase family enzyme